MCASKSSILGGHDLAWGLTGQTVQDGFSSWNQPLVELRLGTRRLWAEMGVWHNRGVAVLKPLHIFKMLSNKLERADDSFILGDAIDRKNRSLRNSVVRRRNSDSRHLGECVKLTAMTGWRQYVLVA
jgi:hypothetical protein